MIQGRTDTWHTLPEFAAMVGRSEKTIQNWAANGQIQFVHLCGVPLVSMAMVETLIAGRPAEPRPGAEAAMRAISRRDRSGLRTTPERHRSQRRMTRESASAPLLHSSQTPVGSRLP